MILLPVLCPHCHSDHVIKGGKTKTSRQRYKCANPACPHDAFQLDLQYKGHLPAIQQDIVAMGLKGSGIRDTTRGLKISPTTVMNALKKEPALTSVPPSLLATLHPDDVDVMSRRAEEAEVDAMWSFVGKKNAPRWWWPAIDHHPGKVLAYVCGRH
jgi:insertion element IS1 protein InsB